MKPRPPRPAFDKPTVATPGAIEWEELPSLVGRLHAATLDATPAPAWEATAPAPLDDSAPSEPFRESMHGLAVREVLEPEVFRHFFGAVHPRG